MSAAPKPEDEKRRLEALDELQILGTATERAWDQIVEIASILCGTPISLVSLIDSKRQWFKASVGLPVKETPREYAFCAHAILGSDILEVEDASRDARFAENPLVTGDPKIRFYAGTPVAAPDGSRLGTVCVIDREPRKLTEAQLRGLQLLGRQAESLFASRLLSIQLRDMLERDIGTRFSQDQMNEFSDTLLNPLTPILLHTAMLKRDPSLSEQSIRSIDLIEDSALRIRNVAKRAIKGLLGEPDALD